MSNHLFFYRAYTQYENLGDIIINKTMVSHLRNYGNLMIDDLGVPEWYCQELELTDNERASQHGHGQYHQNFFLLIVLFRFASLIRLQPRNTYLVKGLGHDAMDISPVEGLYAIISSLILKLLGVNIIRCGVSIGPFSRRRRIVENVLARLMYFYSVRDQTSANYAHKIGIKKVAIFPDLAWLMEVPQATKSLLAGQENYVIFSFRSIHRYSKTETGSDNQDIYRLLDDIVQKLCIQGDQKLVICYQVTRDREFCRSLHARYQNQCEAIFIEQQVDRQFMSDLYSRASMIFSNRLHVLLFGLICGSIPIAVINQKTQAKVSGIFSDAGLMKLVLDTNQATIDWQHLREIMADAPTLKQEMKHYRDRQRDYGLQLLQHLVD